MLQTQSWEAHADRRLIESRTSSWLEELGGQVQAGVTGTGDREERVLEERKPEERHP